MERSTDREKVIKGIECHRKKVQTTNAVSCLECPYAEPKPIREWCMSGLMDDIYAMLKEQESVIEALKSDLSETLAVLSEQPEIVRCRDCKYWRQLYGDESGRCVCDDMWRSLDGEAAEVEDIRTDSDFYCGYAVRR